MVSESLRNLLVGEMNIVPSVDVTILAPDEQGGARRINLFLYRVAENPFFKNRDWEVRANGAGQLSPPPLTLNLYYLMTPYAQNDPQTGNSSMHEVLGEAMRVFYENPVIPEEYLVNGLSSTTEQLKIILQPVEPEELSRVWGTFNEPFRTSVMYEVSLVQVDMLPENERPVPTRVRSIGVPDVRAPFVPPVLEAIEPVNGPAGTTITFHGEHLEGWSAYVTVLGRLVLNGAAIPGESFTMDLPNDLTQGFHEIRVDISHLHRRTFFFEVTA
jgi:hypothetical protein